MFLSSAASYLDLAQDNTAPIWSAVAVGAVALVSSYSFGVMHGKKKKKPSSKMDKGPRAPMVCPFSGRSSTTNDKKSSANIVFKTYKFDISSEHKNVVKATLPLVAECGTKFTEHFYKRLFQENPELKNLFNQTNQAIGNQPKRLFNLIAAAATAAIDAGEISGEVIEAVAQKHVALGVPPEAYSIVGATILATIQDLLTTDQAVLDAWEATYGEIARIFIERESEIHATMGWKGRRTFRLVKKEAKSDVITRLQFCPVDEYPVPAFASGQYTTVWVKVPDDSSGIHGRFHEQPRHYTLAVEDGKDDNAQRTTLSISVKREGLISKILHESPIGSEFDLSAPSGCFALKDVTTKISPVVFLSAGVGVTPVLAMLEDLVESNSSNTAEITWLHSAKNGNHHAYRDRVRHIAATKGSAMMKCRVWYSNPTNNDGPPASQLESSPSLVNLCKYHYQGRMDLSMHVEPELLYLDNSKTNYYICGPKGFMESATSCLLKFGVDESRIHSEGF